MAGSSFENVADLIARPPEEYVPEPRYISKYREKVKRAAKRGKSAHKTLGVPNVNLNPPTEYLKKNSKDFFKRPEIHHKHYHRPGYQHKLPDWQPIKAADKEVQISQSHSIDFTKRNIDEAKSLQPLKPRKYYVDDRHGTAHPLRSSGLLPIYIHKKNYGQRAGDDSVAPENRNKLRDKMRDKNQEEKSWNQREDRSNVGKSRKWEDKLNEKKSMKLGNDKVSHSAEDKLSKEAKTKDLKVEKKSTKSTLEDEESVKSSRPQQPRCRYVTEDERAELLYGMKKKWDEMMKQFQCLPFLTDTPPKAKRKTNMEKDLYQLEKDIEVIERHPYIYVYSDTEEDS